MTLVSWAKEFTRLRIRKSFKLQLPRTTASVNSLAMPLVQEVVLEADLGCIKCQKRVVDVISEVHDIESMVVHVLEKKVMLTHKSVSKGPLRKVGAVNKRSNRGFKIA